MKIEGKKLAEKILKELKNRVGERRNKPALAILQIGDLPESNAYIKQKKNAAEKIGIKVIHNQFPANVPESVIISRVEEYNKNDKITGIILQLPLPPSLNPETIIAHINPAKDVDGFLENSLYTPPVACAVLTVLTEICQQSSFEFLKKKKIAIIGRGKTGGQPIMQELKKKAIPFQSIHSQTKNPEKILKQADIIISCVGKPGILRADKIKNKAILISVGIHKNKDGKLQGDYNEEEIKDKAAFYTPTPGGIGPLTVACLLKNVIYSLSGTSHEPLLIED